MLDPRRAAALLLAALLFFGLAVPLAAQSPALAPSAAAAPGVDLIFVVDHSGSMWRHPKYPSGPNDVGGHRVGAVRDAIERLAQDAEKGRAVHTVGVIDFNSKVYTVLDGVELRRVGGQSGVALARARAEAGKVQDRRELAHPFTNTAAAFQAALASARKLRPPSARRQRAVILITDGRPYVDGPGDYASKLQKQRESLRQSIGALAGQGFETWVVGINDADEYWHDSRYGLSDGDFWAQATSNRARLAIRAFPDIQRLVGDILDAKVGGQGVLVSGDTAEVPPFQQRAVFNVTADRPGAPLDVIDPQGRLWAANPQPGSQSARVVIPNPAPGSYRIIRQSSYAYTIRLELDPPGAERLEPAGLAPLMVASRLVLRLTGDGGAALPVTPTDIADVRLTATGPSGKPQSLAPGILPDGRIAADWTPAEAGLHSLALAVTARHGGGTTDIFVGTGSPPLSVEVSSKRPVFLTLDSPHPGGTQALLGLSSSLRTRFGLESADGRAATAAEAGIGDPGTFLTLRRVDEAGTPYGPVIPTIFDGQGHWSADIPLEPAWLDGEGWWRPVRLRLRAVPAATALGGDQELDSLRLPADALDHRVAGDPWTVGPLDAAVPLWLVGVAAALLVLVLLAAFGALLALALPGVIVRSRDGGSGRRLQIVLHDPVADPFKGGARKVPVDGRYKMRIDRKLVLQVDGNTVVLPRFRFTRDLAATRSPAGVIRYRWPADNKDRVLRLRAGEPPRQLLGNPQSQYVIGLDQLKT